MASAHRSLFSFLTAAMAALAGCAGDAPAPGDDGTPPAAGEPPSQPPSSSGPPTHTSPPDATTPTPSPPVPPNPPPPRCDDGAAKGYGKNAPLLPAFQGKPEVVLARVAEALGDAVRSTHVTPTGNALWANTTHGHVQMHLDGTREITYWAQRLWLPEDPDNATEEVRSFLERLRIPPTTTRPCGSRPRP